MDNLQYLAQLYTDILISWSCIIDECDSLEKIWKMPTARQALHRKERRLKKYIFWSRSKQPTGVNCTRWYLIDLAAPEENKAHGTSPLGALIKPTWIVLRFCPGFRGCCTEKLIRSPWQGRTEMNKHPASVRHHRTILLTGDRKQYRLHHVSKFVSQFIPSVSLKVLIYNILSHAVPSLDWT